MQRRTFLKGSLASSTVAVAMGAGLLSPGTVLAAWPKSAFGAKTVQDAISAVHGSAATRAATLKLKLRILQKMVRSFPSPFRPAFPGLPISQLLWKKMARL